jgi:hypothetical protein
MKTRIEPLAVDQLPLYGRLTHWLAGRFAPALQIPVRIKSKAPLLMFGEYVYEICLLRSKHLDTRLKELAAMRASSLVGCPG